MASQSGRSSLRTLIGLVLFAVTRLGNGADSCGPSDLGCSIFSGQQAVKAHLRDHDYPLPAGTSQCINCHGQTEVAPAFALPLTRSYLLDSKSRRGGPPIRYNQVVFCRVLKDGVDPAGVLLYKSMPHYELSDTECAALWRFFTNK
jgi:hypothetical protein